MLASLTDTLNAPSAMNRGIDHENCSRLDFLAFHPLVLHALKIANYSVFVKIFTP